jgi:hypothetical protein
MTTSKLIWKPLVNGRGYWAKGTFQYKIYKMVSDDLKCRFECHIAFYHNDFDFFSQDTKQSLKQAKNYCLKIEDAMNKYIISSEKEHEVSNDN